MDCGDEGGCPPSTSPLLLQQYQEQSSLCDVIIKVGLWEKRFHWCVLIASPFFEKIYRNQFLEKQTGKIQLNQWTSLVVEMALLFLYGQRPDITQDNVDALLDIAEFLMIPQLKVACVNFLKKEITTMENCVQLFQLSSLYDFELEACVDFIKGNLPEVLQLDGMLAVTTDTMKMLLADPTLSYVTAECWFKFLVRWVNKVPERQRSFADLFCLLDFSECDEDYINNVVAQEPLMTEVKEEAANTLSKCLDELTDTLLIFQHACCKPFWLNMRTMLWNRVDISSDTDFGGNLQVGNNSFDGVKNKNSSFVYKVSSSCNSFNILSHDLSNSQSSVSTVVVSTSDGEDNAASVNDFHHYSLANNILAVVSNKEVKLPFGAEERALQQRLQEAYLDDTTIIDHLIQLDELRERMEGRVCKDMRISTLYIGHLAEPKTEMRAILTLRDHNLSKICTGDGQTIAMLSEDDNSLFIYEESTMDLQCIHLNTDFGIEMQCTEHLVAIENGFVFQHENQVVYILRLSGPALKMKYHVSQVSMDDVDMNFQIKYLFDGDRCYRYMHKQFYPYESTLEYVRHRDLTIAVDVNNLFWNKIHMPNTLQEAFCTKFSVFAISVPKGVIRCHLECPHCNLTKGRETQRIGGCLGNTECDTDFSYSDDDSYDFLTDSDDYDYYYSSSD